MTPKLFSAESFIESCKPHVVNERWAEVVAAIANDRVGEMMKCEGGGVHMIGSYAISADNAERCLSCSKRLLLVAEGE